MYSFNNEKTYSFVRLESGAYPFHLKKNVKTNDVIGYLHATIC